MKQYLFLCAISIAVLLSANNSSATESTSVSFPCAPSTTIVCFTHGTPLRPDEPVYGIMGPITYSTLTLCPCASGTRTDHWIFLNTVNDSTGIGYVGNGVRYCFDSTNTNANTMYLSIDTTTFQTYTNFASWFSAVTAYNGGGEPSSVNVLSDILPTGINIVQNYPNPFSNYSEITFTVTDAKYFGNELSLSLTDMLGKNISMLYRGSADGNKHIIGVDAATLVSGTYYYRLTCGQSSISKILTVQR